MPRLVILSDTHGRTVELPEGDILIHCGDWSGVGTFQETSKFLSWLERETPKYKHTLIVPGNHDRYIESNLAWAEEAFTNIGANLLVMKEKIIDGVKFFGQPNTPTFGNWAFMCDRAEMGSIYATIPDEVDVLICHGAPHGFLDGVEHWNSATMKLEEEHVGCYDLLKYIERVEPKVCCFGHIHYYGGQQYTVGKTRLVNAAICNEDYKIGSKPIVIDL